MTRGNWGEVCDSFDKRKKKVANDGELGGSEDGGPDMFEQAGVAAE